MKRRSFLKTVSSTVGAGALGVTASHETSSFATDELEKVQGMPRRVMGRTGLKVSTLTFPGLALKVQDQEREKENPTEEELQQQCNNALHDALARGVNYFDVAPAYGKDGICEIRMGIGLEDVKRSDYVLSCKTKRRDKEGCREELERSLKRLKTDYFDVYQLHCLMKPEDVTEALGPGGAMETILEAKKEGKIRHIGFSAHTTKAALHALKHFEFDTAMFPINFVEYYTIGFGKPVLELASKQGVAVLGMKTLSHGRWPKDVEKTRAWWYRPTEEDEKIRLALQFTLSQEPVVTAIPPGWLDLLDKAIDEAKQVQPATQEDLEKARTLAQGCESVFHRYEIEVTSKNAGDPQQFADNPHDSPPCMFS